MHLRLLGMIWMRGRMTRDSSLLETPNSGRPSAFVGGEFSAVWYQLGSTISADGAEMPGNL